MHDIPRLIKELWENGKIPDLPLIANSVSQGISDYAEVVCSLLNADRNERINRNATHPDWEELVNSSWRTDVSFEILYERLLDSSERHAARIREDPGTSTGSIEEFLPARLDPHAAYYEWFLEYLVFADKTTRFEVDRDSPPMEPSSYVSLCSNDSEELLNNTICSITKSYRQELCTAV